MDMDEEEDLILNSRKDYFNKNSNRMDLLKLREDSRIKLRKQHIDSVFSKHRKITSKQQTEFRINKSNLKIDEVTLYRNFNDFSSDEMISFLLYNDNNFIKFGLLILQDKISKEKDDDLSLAKLANYLKSTGIIDILFELLRSDDISIQVSYNN